MNTMVPFSTRNLFDELFRDVGPGFFVKPLHGDPLPAHIRVDVKEDKESYTLHAELPGVAKDDIHATVKDGLVTIQAEIKQQDTQRQDEKVLRSERYFGSVARSFALPQDVDASAAQASYENGVLTLLLPKKLAAGAQKLVIR